MEPPVPPPKTDSKVLESACWKLGREIFLDRLRSSSNQIDDTVLTHFFSDNFELKKTISSCQAMKTKVDKEYRGSGGPKFVAKLIDVLNRVREIGDPFLHDAPHGISIAWSAVSILIKFGVEDVKQCEIISEACSSIVTIVLNCRLYEIRHQDASRDADDVDPENMVYDAIPNVIALVLHFAWQIQYHLSKNKLVRTFQRIFQSEIKSCIAKVENEYFKLRELANDAFQSVVMDYVRALRKDSEKNIEALQSTLFPALEDIKSKLEDVADIKRTIDKNEIRKQFEAHRKNLNITDYHDRLFAAAFKPIEKSCGSLSRWLFSEPAYHDWERAGSVKTLCITGAPGFGKSVIMTCVITRLKSERSLYIRPAEERAPIVLHFYFKTGDDATQLVIKAIESIAAQLVSTSVLDEDDLQSVIEILKTARGPSPGGMVDGEKGDGREQTLRSAAVTDGLVSNTLDFLQDIIEKVGEYLGRLIYIVIDAVDECEDREREGLITILKTLSRSTRCRIQVIVSSRDSINIEGLLSDPDTLEGDIGPDIKMIHVTKDTNADDMEIYLGREVEALLTKRRQCVQDDAVHRELHDIVDTIQQKANGSFRYAAMAIASLELPYRCSLREKLGQLPDGMDGLYKKNLESLNPEERTLVHIALMRIVWGFGEISKVEVAEQYKRVYETVSTFDGKAKMPMTMRAGGDYDPANDLEIVDTLLHLERTGRDFLKFNENIVDVQHKSVRDWVEREALQAQESESESLRPFLAADEHGQWRLCFAIPTVTVMAPGHSATFEFPSKRDAHLEITLYLLQNLIHPLFQSRYMLSDAPREPYRSELTQLDDHLTAIQDSWAPEERQGKKWPLFWSRIRKFVRPKLFDGFLSHYLTWQSSQLSWSNQNAFSVLTPESGPLAWAVFRGHLMLVTFLVEECDVDVNKSTAQYDRTPLHLALMAPHINVVKFLVSHGADIDANDAQRETPLHVAVQTRHLELVDLLLKQQTRETVKHADDNSFTALHKVFWNSEKPDIAVEIIKRLLQAGADPNAQDYSSSGPLVGAISTGNADAVRLLLECGADANDDDEWGYTALHTALRSEEANADIIRHLLKGKADFERQTKDGLTPLAIAIECGNMEIVNLLLEKYKDRYGDDRSFLLRSDKHRRTLLHGCADTAIVGTNIFRTLIHGLSPDQIRVLLETRDHDNDRSPLDLASMHGNKELVEFLLEQYHSDNKSLLTALHNSLGEDANVDLDVVRILLDSGADFERDTADGQTPLAMAVAHGNLDVVKLFFEKYKEKYGDDRAFLFPVDKRGRTLLYRSAESSDSGLDISRLIIQDLLPIQVSSLLRTRDLDKHLGPLDLAVMRHDKELLYFLIQHADLQGSKLSVDLLPTESRVGTCNDDEFLHTALHAALEDGVNVDIDVVRTLLDHGVDFEREGEDGQTPLAMAISHGDLDIVNLFLDRYKEKYAEDNSFLLRADKQGRTLLYRSANIPGDRVDIAHLITKDLPPDQIRLMLDPTDFDEGCGPLHVAARQANKAILEFLIVLGADTRTKTKSGQLPVDLVYQEWLRVLDYGWDQILASRYEQCFPILLALTPEILHENGMYLQTVLKYGWEIPLQKAAEQGVDPFMTDSHGWNLFHFARAFDKLQMMKDQFPSYDCPKALSMPTIRPSQMSPTKKGDSINISEDGLEFWVEDPEAPANLIISDHPILAEERRCYFEVSILQSANPHALVGIGFTEDRTDFEAMPGWARSCQSFGYHGDDGKLFRSTSFGLEYEGRRGPKEPFFGAKSVIGCGLDMDQRIIFYTLNGEYLGPAFKDVPPGRWFLTVGIHETARASVNFGSKPFMFSHAYDDVATF